MKTVKIILENSEGLHARPASLLSKLAVKQKSHIEMIKNDIDNKIYNAKSIMSILSMGAIEGDEITVIAEGEDEEEAITLIADLIRSGF